jgi:serine/threonine protein kinase
LVFLLEYLTRRKLKYFEELQVIWHQKLYQNKEFKGPPADIWALGVLLYALLCGKFPFKGKSDKELYQKINNGEYEVPEHVSFAAQTLISKMIVVDPSKRISASEILKDPWLQDNESFLKFYRFNGNDLVNKNKWNCDMESSPYKDKEANKGTDLPYEAYFPADARKMSKEALKM